MSDKPVAGWYEDTEPGSARLRYWDGEQWTQQYMDKPASAAPAYAADGSQAAYGQADAFGQAAGQQPGAAGLGQPTYGQPAYDQQAAGQTAYGQPTYEQPTYGQPSAAPLYGQPGVGMPSPGQQPAVPQQSNGLAIGSLICGIVGFIIFGLILGIVAISLGIQGRKGQSLRGVATAGIVLGVIDIAAWALLIFSGVLFSIF
jgi:hypothetical protein